MAAVSGLTEDGATRVHLQPVCNWGQPEFGRNCVSIPFHEWCTDFKNPIAVETDDLGLLGFIVPNCDVKFKVFADVYLSEETAFRHDGSGGCA